MKTLLNFCLIVYCLMTPCSIFAKSPFAPKDDKILVFIGQDNRSIGANGLWRDGYSDHMGIPAGISHYVYFSEGKTNQFGYQFDVGAVDGLNSTTRWGAGPKCLRCLLETPAYKGTLVHLSISMELDEEGEVASGNYDHLIRELADFLKEFDDHIFYLRIGYEFDGSWNHYDPELFKLAWRRIVDQLKSQNLTNFATVMGASRYYVDKGVWETYWPGDDYVDWLGYSYWHNENRAPVVFDLAREKGLPVFIAEITPRGFWLNQVDGDLIWNDWFQLLFDHIDANQDVIRAISYINANWNSDPMWHGKGWGDSRIQINTPLKLKWLEKMATAQFIHNTQSINFE